MARQTQASVTSKKTDMTGQLAQGPSKDIPPTVLNIKQPGAAVPGDNLGGAEPKIEPVQANTPNAKFEAGFYDK